MKFGASKWWKDRAALLAVSLILAFLAWAFGHAAGEWSSLVLGVVILVVLFMENRRLRKDIRRLSDSKRSAGH